MRAPSFRRTLLVFTLCLATALSASAADTYRVIHAYPHDEQAFTQGLVFVDGHLYESTGINGRSSLREEDLNTGRILKFQDVPSQYFAEGLTNWGSTLVQLTWQHHIAFVYDRSTFRFIRAFHYDYEGWGLTQDGKDLIESDGSATLRFIDPTNFQTVRTITVRDHGLPVTQLNELEYIHGQIYANIWHKDRIARISPATGRVIAWIDLTGLLPPGSVTNPEAVLNGIAYDSAHDRLFVTGKLWPKIFEIKVIPEPPKPPRAAPAR
ncbi:MAG: glutaminyl-peptide cyclotransferase [Terracidiphilus sp.]